MQESSDVVRSARHLPKGARRAVKMAVFGGSEAPVEGKGLGT